MWEGSTELLRHGRVCAADVDALMGAFRGGVMRYVQHRPGNRPTEIHDLHSPLLNLRHASFGEAMTTLSDDGVERIGFVISIRGELNGCGQPTTDGNLVHYDIENGVQLRVPAGARFVSGSIDRGLAERLAEQHGYRRLEQTRGPELPSGARERLIAGIRALTVDQATAGFSDDQIQDAVCLAVLRSLDPAEGRHRPKLDARRRVVRRALEYIEAHHANDLTITELCEIAGATERTLRYSFVDLVGMSPQRYLIKRRLDRARMLLRAAPPGTTVEAVARSSGFRHPGRFAAYFRGAFGESPRSLLERSRVALR